MTTAKSESFKLAISKGRNSTERTEIFACISTEGVRMVYDIYMLIT